MVVGISFVIRFLLLYFVYVVVFGNHVFEEITCWSGVSYIMLFSFVF